MDSKAENSLPDAARRSIEKISGGKVYVRKRGKRETEVHIASKPGDAPNKDSGDLIRNIRVSKVEGNARRGYSASVEAVTPYASYLEYGAKRMKARPFMAPALAKNKPKIAKLIRNAVRSAL